MLIPRLSCLGLHYIVGYPLGWNFLFPEPYLLRVSVHKYLVLAGLWLLNNMNEKGYLEMWFARLKHVFVLSQL